MFSQLRFLDAWVPSLLVFVLLAAAWLLGRFSAHLLSRRAESDPSKLNEVFVTLLALLLAFSFATAYARYEARRELVAIQASDIGTFFTSTQLMPEPAKTRVQQQVRQYTELFLQAGDLRDQDDLRALDARAEAVQNAIVQEVMEYARTSDKPTQATSVMAAMNAMLSAYESRVVGSLNRGPLAVLLLQAVVAIASAFLIGRSHALEHRHHTISMMVLFILIAAIIYVTLDFDHPATGISRANQTPILRLAKSIGIPGHQ